MLVVGCTGAVWISGIRGGVFVSPSPIIYPTRRQYDVVCPEKHLSIWCRRTHRPLTALLPHRPRTSRYHGPAPGTPHSSQQRGLLSSAFSLQCGQTGDRPPRSYEYHRSPRKVQAHLRSEPNRSSTGLARSRMPPRTRHPHLKLPTAVVCATSFSASTFLATRRQKSPPTAFPSCDASPAGIPTTWMKCMHACLPAETWSNAMLNTHPSDLGCPSTTTDLSR